ncbi:MAG: CrcB family protein [Actinomycetota bacterium]|nr:CrcB family protein [Actinomycetota bacterium]
MADPHADAPRALVDPDQRELAAAGRRRRRAERAVLLTVAVAGAIGALARDGVSRLMASPAGHFPWGTFAINVSGSAAIGLVLVLLVERFPAARLARPLVVTGFLGAYTTYSTYMVDADLLFRSHDLVTGAAYVLASLLAGTLAVAGGIVLGRFLVRFDGHLSEHLP